VVLSHYHVLDIKEAGNKKVYDIHELHDITSKNAIPIKYQPSISMRMFSLRCRYTRITLLAQFYLINIAHEYFD